MALKYLVDLDLSGNEVQNFALQTSSGVPTGLATGHIVYDTAASQVKIFNGSEWAVVGLVADETSLTVSSGTISIKDLGVSTGKLADLAVTNAKIANNTIALGKLANIANGRILGNVSGSAGIPAELTAAQVRTLINVADGAEVNVQSDWNATSGDALILNKPTLGTLAALNSVNAATITDNSVGAAELNVSGNGTAGQVLASDGDGTFSWVANLDEDVNVTNLAQRLSEIGGDITIGNSSGGTITVAGNLTVAGTTTTVNTETINLADNVITLNSNATDDSENGGIEVYRGGGAPNVAIRWNATRNAWEFTNSGTTYDPIPTPDLYTNNTGTVTSVAVSGADGIAVSGSPITTDGTISLSLTDDSIANAKLANDSITINGTAVALGGSINVGDITGVTAGAGLSGGGTTGTVTVSNDYINLSISATGADAWFNIDAAANQFRALTAVVTVFDEDGGGSMVLTDVRRSDDSALNVFLPTGNFTINISAIRA